MQAFLSKKIFRIALWMCVPLVGLSLVGPFLSQQVEQRGLDGRNNHIYMALTSRPHATSPPGNWKAPDEEPTEGETISAAQRTGQRGYLVVLDLPEQLTAATRGLAQLYIFNQRHLKLEMIEPYVLKSHLKTVPPVSEDFRSLPLISAFLNRSQLLHSWEKCFHSGRLKLHSFPDFLINTAREFITVAFITKEAIALKRNVSACDYNVKHVEYILNYHLEKVKDRAFSKHGRNYTFKGVHELCVRAIPGEPFSMKEVAQSIRTWMTNVSKTHREPFFPQFSVVVLEWRRVSTKRDKFYYYDPSYTSSNMTWSCQLPLLEHTSFVTQVAKYMLQRLSLPRPFIAVHVRSERIAIQGLQQHGTDFIDTCIHYFSNILPVIMIKHNISLDRVVFIHDGSEYGTDSMEIWKKKASSHIISKLKEIGIRNVQYKPQSNLTDVNNSTALNSALVQFVEKEFLLSADVLITLGSGGFQNSLIAKFKRKNNSWYKLCSNSHRNDHLPLTVTEL